LRGHGIGLVKTSFVSEAMPHRKQAKTKRKIS
jgi:hypothetical protein